MMSIKLSGIIIAEAFFGIKLSEKYYSTPVGAFHQHGASPCRSMPQTP